MSVPNDPISGFFLTTTPIRYDGSQGHATGFFLNYEGTTYMVTNRHVFDIQTHNGEPLKQVRIYIRTNPTDLSSVEARDISLYFDGSKNWKGHSSGPTTDIAVIPLKPPVVDQPIQIPSHNPSVGESPIREHEYDVGNLSFSFQDLPSQREVVDGTIVTSVRGGSHVMILGYPLRVTESYLPVARNALISSPYGTRTRDQPYFLVDARTHPGLSGSPVITAIPDSTDTVRVSDTGFDTKAAAKLMRDVEWYLIGIHAQAADVAESLELNGVFYPHLLRDILEDSE